MDIILNYDETLEDLQCKGYKIIQRADRFKFGIDAVLAAHFSEKFINPGDTILDLGTGTGIIPILIAARSLDAKIVGLEIQEDMAEMARRSVQLNKLDERISIVTGNIVSPPPLPHSTYNHVISNPPYKKVGSGIINPGNSKAVSRHEVLCTLEDVLSLAAKCLKQHGIFTMVNRPERLCDCMELMRKYKLEPKVIRFVHPSPNKAPNMMLIRCIKNGKPFLKTEPPLYVFDESGKHTDEINEIYNRE